VLGDCHCSCADDTVAVGTDLVDKVVLVVIEVVIDEV
jgi:hypothetical protein